MSAPSSPRRFGVIGHPARHSLSPWVHAQFARATQRPTPYGIYEDADFNAAARAFFEQGGGGLNVTVPHKAAAAAFAAHQSGVVKKTGAANVLHRRQDGGIMACNTDGAGLTADIEKNCKVALADKSVLLLGAGGAARGVLPALAARKPAMLFVANRTPQKAREVAALAADSCPANSGGFEDAPAADILINATAASHGGGALALPPKIFSRAALAYDMSYDKNARAFLSAAAEAGVKQTINGIGMLVEQAALSFAIWHGIKPSTGNILAALRSSFRVNIAE